MSPSTIRYTAYPRTELPPEFAPALTDLFRKYEQQIGTGHLSKGLESNAVLRILRDDLIQLGFEVETGKRQTEKIHRPVFFGENGRPVLSYQVDAFHPGWSCGLEVEAGRAWMGNAVYRDLIQALVMVQVEVLVLAVPNTYKYQEKGKQSVSVSRDYDNATNVVETLYSHSRFKFPYRLVLIGY